MAVAVNLDKLAELRLSFLCEVVLVGGAMAGQNIFLGAVADLLLSLLTGLGRLFFSLVVGKT